MCPSSISSSSALRGRQRWAATLSTGLFLTLTAGAGLLDVLAPPHAPRPRGAERRADRRWRQRARIGDGTQMAVWERDLELRSNLRKHLVPLYTAALLRWLREATPPVVVGDRGWLFIRDRLEPGRLSDERMARFSARYLAAIQRRLSTFGVRLVVVPVPRKGVVCRRFLPAGVDPRPRLERSLVDALREEGVTTVDLMEVFEGHAPAELYYRQDSHWTRFGQLLAAEATCREAGLLVPSEVRPTILEDAGWQRARQGLLSTLGIDPRNPGVKALLSTDRDPLLVPMPADGPTLSEPESMPRCAVVGTSFANGEYFVDYLRHFAGEPIWNGARSAEDCLGSLGLFVDEQRSRLPEVLVLEIPVHQLFVPSVRQGTVPLRMNRLRFFLDHPPPATTVLVPAGRVEIERTVPGTDPAERRVVARIPEGLPVGSADGASAIRIRGEGGARRVTVQLTYHGSWLAFGWDESRREAVLPLITYAAEVGPIEVSLTGPGACAFEVRGIDVVLE